MQRLCRFGLIGCEWEETHPFVTLIARLAALRASASHG